jgi:putative hydrolase of the HAD superfamily
MSDAPHVVCFDAGGVLVEICRSWAEGCRAADLDVRGDVDASCGPGSGFPDINAAYQRGEIALEEFADGVHRLVDGLYTVEEIIRVHHAWTLDEYPGISALVDALHEGGIETAMLSNTSHDHWITFPDRYPGLMRIRHRHGSHLIGVCKPDAAAYEVVEASTGARGPEILFFDDLEENVEGARAMGWRAQRIDPLASTIDQMRSWLERFGLL